MIEDGTNLYIYRNDLQEQYKKYNIDSIFIYMIKNYYALSFVIEFDKFDSIFFIEGDDMVCLKNKYNKPYISEHLAKQLHNIINKYYGIINTNFIRTSLSTELEFYLKYNTNYDYGFSVNVKADGELIDIKISPEPIVIIPLEDKVDSIKEEIKTMDINKHIEEILIWFDFEKVKKIMDATDWKWALEENVSENGVPEVEAIKEYVVSRIKEIYERALKNEQSIAWSSSGGFTIKVDIPNDEINVDFGIGWNTQGE